MDNAYELYAESIRAADTLDALNALKNEIQRQYAPERGDRYTLIGEIACRRLELLRYRLGARPGRAGSPDQAARAPDEWHVPQP